MYCLNVAVKFFPGSTKLFNRQFISSLHKSALKVNSKEIPCLFRTHQVSAVKHVSFMNRNNFISPFSFQKVMMSTSNKNEENSKLEKSDESDKPVETSLSTKEKFKQAFKDYGATVVVFHIGISLISLGSFYLAASRGLNLDDIIQSVGFDSPVTAATVGGASTFVVAYAIHKVLAPVRISITLFATPFIVRYLRKKGILKVKTAEKN